MEYLRWKWNVIVPGRNTKKTRADRASAGRFILLNERGRRSQKDGVVCAIWVCCAIGKRQYLVGEMVLEGHGRRRKHNFGWEFFAQTHWKPTNWQRRHRGDEMRAIEKNVCGNGKKTEELAWPILLLSIVPFPPLQRMCSFSPTTLQFYTFYLVPWAREWTPQRLYSPPPPLYISLGPNSTWQRILQNWERIEWE